MATSTSIEMLERLLESVTRAFSPEVARRLLEVRPDTDVQRRLDELADRHSAGDLSADERAEYETLVNVGMVISLLQMKARELLAKNTAA